jgi:urease accessory protein
MLHLSAKTKTRATALAVTALAAVPAFAHPGADHVHGFADGFAHPFAGWDHLLAMLAVGLWAAQHKRSAMWLLPLAFPLMMAVGALLGISGIALSGMEAGIGVSVAVLGLLVAFAVKMPAWGSAMLVSLFALLHGYAHGMELPKEASPLVYGSGFVAATSLLHLVGLTAGLLGEKTAGKLVRLMGAGIAAMGIFLLGGLA